MGSIKKKNAKPVVVSDCRISDAANSWTVSALTVLVHPIHC